MNRLCSCFVSVAPPKPALPAPKKKEKDDKTQVREFMITKLQKDKGTVEKFTDLDDLIKNRSEVDIDVDELIQNAQASLEKLDNLIGKVRSLFARNDKVMKRCEEFRCESPDAFTFYRIVIDFVKVESTPDKGGKTLLSFKTTPRRETKTFGIPPSLPSDLTKILVAQPGFAGLPDYELFLELSLLLHNDVLKPFLQIYYGHLEQIQAFYKEIDGWISAPRPDRHFLEQTFGIDFDFTSELVDHEEDTATQPTLEAHSDTSSHSSDDYVSFAHQVDDTLFSKAENHDDVMAAMVKDSAESGEDEMPESVLDEDSEDEHPTVLQEKVNLEPYSKIKRATPGKEVVIKQCSALGSYSLEFFIDQDGQKGKLSKFLEFLGN